MLPRLRQNTGIAETIELDRHRVKTLSWQVGLNDGKDDFEVIVDAATGKVIKVDRD